MDFNTISIIIFYSFIAFLIIKNKDKIERRAGIIFMYQSKLGIATMNRLAKYERFWKIWAYLGIPICFLGMAFIFFYLFQSFLFPTPEAAISPVIPGVKIPGSSIYLPFWYGILSLFSLLVFHEGAHGVIARVHKIKVESTGVGLLAILPFAFVKPNEKQISRLSPWKRISIYAAGPFANITTAAIALVFFVFVLTPVLVSAYSIDGLKVVNIEDGFPAQLGGLASDDIINSIDGISSSNISEVYSALLSKKPGDVATFGLEDGSILKLVAVENPKDSEDGHFGFGFEPVLSQKEGAFYAGPFKILAEFLKWFIILSFGVGLFNLLPLGPLDGGKMAKDGLTLLIKRKQLATRIFIYLSVLSLSLLLVGIFRPLLT